MKKMIFKYSDKEKVFENDKAVGYRIAETECKEFVELSIIPGGVVPEHSLPINVSFHVKEGRGEAIVNGESVMVKTGDVLVVNKDVNREWRNESFTVLVLLVIKDKK